MSSGASADGFLSRITPDRKFLVLLIILALATRLVWILWVHPPADYVFSDMKKYVDRAQFLAENGWVWERRTMAWQSWGTHYILAVPLAIFGKDNLLAGAVLWALMSAASVPMGYLLACRVSSRPLLTKIAGVAFLLWHPSMSNSGYFLSETPFLLVQLWSTYWLVRTLQEGKRAVGAGLVSAVAFAVRPQSALFFVLVLLTWLYHRKRLPHVGWKQLVAIAAPLLLMLWFSFWRFEAHTGYGPGIAENANMNLTAGRCHNIVTQAFKTERHKRHSERKRNSRDGRRVSLPGFRMLAKTVHPDNPFALRPAMDSVTIRFVGYVGDPVVHKEIRKECYRRTGLLEQARYSMVNASLLWFVGRQWPEMEKGRKVFLPILEFYKYFFQIVVLFPALIGLVWSVIRIKRRPARTLLAWQLLTSITIAGIFFGTIRLRTPYDPYAILLALEVWWVVVVIVRARVRARKTT